MKWSKLEIFFLIRYGFPMVESLSGLEIKRLTHSILIDKLVRISNGSSSWMSDTYLDSPVEWGLENVI
jgi:hypothetical protein